MQDASILIVEDQRTAAGAMRTRLQGLGYRVAGIIDNGEAALATVSQLMPDLVLMDIRLGTGMDGIEAARLIHETHDIPVVFITAYADEATIARARRASPAGFINKPFTTKDLLTTLQLALWRRNDADDAEVPNAVHGPLPENRPGEGVITADLDGRISFVNRDAERFTGWKRRELLGRQLHEVLGSLYAMTSEQAARAIHRALRLTEGEGLRPFGAIFGHDGDVLGPMRDANGTPFGVLLRFRRVVSSDGFPATDGLAVALKAACDSLSKGLIVVDANLTLHYANQLARSLMREGKWLTTQEGRLSLHDAQQHKVLSRMVVSAATNKDSQQIQGLRLNAGGGAPSLELGVVQLDSGLPTAETQTTGRVAIFIFTAPPTEIDPVVMRDVYQLTAKEVRLAVELLSDHSIEQIARNLQISASTLRTHQKHIFQKAGVCSREDLRWRVRTGPAGLRERLSLLLH